MVEVSWKINDEGTGMKAKPNGRTVSVVDGVGRVSLAVEAFTSLVREVIRHGETIAVEQTKQEQIRAQRDAILAQFSYRRDVLLAVADKVFTERRETLDRIFSSLEDAIAAGDAAMISQVLSAVVTIVKHSPLADMQALAKEIASESYTLDLS